MNKRLKIEVIGAIVMAVILSTLAFYVSQPKQIEEFGSSAAKGMSAERIGGATGVQQFIRENIQGELRKGSFETVVDGLKSLSAQYGGRIPYLSMVYESDAWNGDLNCKIPTENVTSFAFDVRQLMSKHGKVTRINISVTEIEVNQTQQQEEPMSEVSIRLREIVEGESPIISQLGMVVPWLVTGLTWIAQGLVIGVPLCFVSLGIIVMIDRGVLPLWKKQFRGRGLNKTTA